MSNIDEANATSRTTYNEKKEDYYQQLEVLIAEAGFSLQDVLQHFPAFIARRSVPTFVALYELFKLVQFIPGSIVELGVYRGSGMMTFAHLLETFCAQDESRLVYGFDHCQGIVAHDQAIDSDLKPWIDNVLGELKNPEHLLSRLIDIQNQDNLRQGFKRSHFINGDICETIPQFIKDNPHLKLSLIHFDVGLYAPTKAALETLYPHLVKGGVVCFNGYGMRPWEGEARAIEEYFEKTPVMKKFNFSSVPHAYFIKEE